MTSNPKRLFAASLLTWAALLAPLAPRAAQGQETFKVGRALRGFELTVSLKSCGDEAHACAGPARVEVYRKGAAAPFQVLSMPNVEVYRDTVEHNEETGSKPRRVYAEEYSFVGGDFNFDGLEDLAVCNGRDGGYGGPSYTVFLYSHRWRRFVESPALSGLTDAPHLGLFFPDPKKRRLTALSKSGCCYHETEVFAVVNNRPVLVEEVIEDATLESGAGEGRVLVTTRRKVRGRWVVTRKRERLRR